MASRTSQIPLFGRPTLLLLAASLGILVAAGTAAHEQPSVSIAELTQRLTAHPDSVLLLLQRAELRRMEGDWAGARADLEHVALLGGDPGELSLAKAALALDRAEPAEALAILQGPQVARTGDPRTHRLRARALVALGDPRGAIAELGDAMARLPKAHPDLYLERARLQIDVGDLDGARAGLDEARGRLGVTASLELFAIELELRAQRPRAARARLVALRAQYADPGALSSLASRIEAAGLTSAEVDDDHFSPAGGRPAAAGRASGSAPAGSSRTTAVVTRGPYLQVGTPEAITVRWRTDTPGDSRVRYGTTPGDLASSVSDSVVTTEHEVRLTGLSPATRYYYDVGTSAGPLAGDDSHTFRTAPPAGSPSAVRLWAIGDSGEPSGEAFDVRDAYAAWTGARGTDLWLMLGDNAYDRGRDEQYQQAVFNQYPAMLRQCVLWPTRGNHDEMFSGANNDYYEIFTMPAAGEAGGLASGTEAYYSFDWGDIHFVCLDSQGSSLAPGSAMLTWLANDLAANARKWLIAFWHHPPYTKGSHDSDNNGDSSGRMRDMRQNVVPILEAGGVDLVLAGHSHSYERSFLLDGHYGQSGTLAPSMIVNGGDGRPDGDGPYLKDVRVSRAHKGAVYSVAGSSSKTGGGHLNHPVMVTSLNVTGSLALDIEGDELEARFLGATGAVLDSFRIERIASLDVPGSTGLASDVRLGPGLPNPFTRDLHIGWTLARPGRVRLDVHDLAGRRVATLENGRREAGTHESRWDGRDASGRLLAGGVYLAVLDVDGRRFSRKISFVR